MTRPTRFFPAVTLLAMFGIVSTTLAGEAELRRVNAELPAAAQRLDELFAQARGTVRIWFEDPRSLGKPPLTEAHFAIDHGMEKVELARSTQGSSSEKLADIVFCVGKGTAFYLYRRSGVERYDVKGIGTTSSDLGQLPGRVREVLARPPRRGGSSHDPCSRKPRFRDH